VSLPPYTPPSDQRASVAAALAPLVVLLAFVLIVTRLVDFDTGFAWCLGSAAWVGWELHDYQRAIDRYNAGYLQQHLAWRSSHSLHALVQADDAHPPTREFVQRFLSSGRVLRRDGPRW
jgi:hypothetical protein